MPEGGLCIESQDMGARSPPQRYLKVLVSYEVKISLALTHTWKCPRDSEVGTQPCSLHTCSGKVLNLLWGVSVCKSLYLAKVSVVKLHPHSFLRQNSVVISSRVFWLWHESGGVMLQQKPSSYNKQINLECPQEQLIILT